MINNLKKWILNKSGMATLLEQGKEAEAIQNDVLNAITFSRLLPNIKWLKRTDFYPGMAAIDNTFFLHLLRIFENVKFTNILEFGLGQSSKMIHQYANYFGISALTIENSQEWYDFFQNDVKDDFPINVKIIPDEIVHYKGFKTRSYHNIESELKDQKFDFVLVDGPEGSLNYSRIQILDIIKNNLMDNFCIMIDDCERNGEQETLREIFSFLNMNKISYKHSFYTGIKKHATICSISNHYLTSI